MPSKKENLDRALAMLCGLEDVTYKQMMGEYMIYVGGKLIGGVYDDRLLLKRTPSAERILAESESGVRRAVPYDGAKEQLDFTGAGAELVRRAVPYDGAKEQLDFTGAGAELVRRAVEALARELPAPKRKK